MVTIDTEKTWEFDIFIKDNDIPENSFIIVDIIIIFPTKGIKSIANCYHENKVLKCQALPKDFDSNYYYIYLLQIKDPNSNSTVTKWNNMEEIKAQVSIDTVNIFNLNYNFATKISEESGQKVFYIEILNNIPLENGSTGKVDILIEDTPKLSQCQAITTTKLICYINSSDDINNKKVFIPKTSTEESTIRWNNLEENQILTPIPLTFKKISNNNLINEHEYKFDIEITETNLKNNLILTVEVYHIINGKKEDEEKSENKQMVPCKSFNNILQCDWISENNEINIDNDLIQLMLKDTGEIIEWTNPGKYGVNYEIIDTDKKEEIDTEESKVNNSDKNEEGKNNESDGENKNESDSSEKNEGKEGNKQSYGNYLKNIKIFMLVSLLLLK